MTFEACLIFHDTARVHLREEGGTFPLCQEALTLQGLQASDPRRRTLAKCQYCEQRKVELQDAEQAA